jgi:glycosyltransferase involved in cell wall biosynthesis
VLTIEGATRRQWVTGLRTLIGERRPDVVHTTLYEANQAGRLAAASKRVPVVSSLVNTPYGPDHLAEPGVSRAKLRLAQVLDTATVRLTRRLHANAAHVADTMSRRLHVPRRRFDVIPRGRDPEQLGRATPARVQQARERLGLAPHQPALLALARHEQQKGLDVAVDALVQVRRAHPDARLLVAGREGQATGRLRAQIEARGVGSAVDLLGFRDDIGDLLAAADVFVLPSRREGFPGVIVEAMALETPIVASDLPGVREALLPANGLLVAIDDAAALGTAVDRVLTDPESAKDRAVAARQRFLDHFTVGSVARQMAAFYERVRA